MPMSHQMDAQLTGLLDVLKSAPKLATETFSRCVCNRGINILATVRRYSGEVNYSEALCDDCRKYFARHARIVCIKCKRLAMLVEPNTDRVTKFQVNSGKHYHIYGCPDCTPGIQKSAVLEHLSWCRGRGIPTVGDMDIVQEIEQKRLQIEKEAAKLKASLSGVFNQDTGAQ